jgi:hypothetical protein
MLCISLFTYRYVRCGSTGVPLVIHYQRLASGKYRACPLPVLAECIIRYGYDSGLLVHPRQSPPDFGHPNLFVWRLERCIPIGLHNEAEDFSLVEQQLVATPDSRQLY